MSRKYYVCNNCTIRNCRRKPDEVSSRGYCGGFRPPHRGFKILEQLVSKDPAGTAKLLHHFGLQLVETKRGIPKVIPIGGKIK